jgi:ATP-dependent RNA helicase DeaD
MLRDIERVTRRRIEVARVPTVADLRARRLELTRVAIREAILAGGLDEYRVVVEALATEFDVVDIALGAVRMADQAAGRDANTEEADIPDAAPQSDGPPRRGPGPRGGRRPGMGRIFVGLGRAAGVTPADLVGAIANKAGISGRDIGTIDITERFSIVEVPEEVAGRVVTALRGATIRGQRMTVRRDRHEDGPRRDGRGNTQ